MLKFEEIYEEGIGNFLSSAITTAAKTLQSGQLPLDKFRESLAKWQRDKDQKATKPIGTNGVSFKQGKFVVLVDPSFPDGVFAMTISQPSVQSNLKQYFIKIIDKGFLQRSGLQNQYKELYDFLAIDYSVYYIKSGPNKGFFEIVKRNEKPKYCISETIASMQNSPPKSIGVLQANRVLKVGNNTLYPEWYYYDEWIKEVKETAKDKMSRGSLEKEKTN